MVESTFRHPKFVLLLVLAGVVVAFVAVAGPRDGGLTGVGDASAADGEDDTTVSTTDPNYDDGVVFTAPGELGEVIVGPTTTTAGGVTSSGSAPGSTLVAPSTTSRPASAAPTTTLETSSAVTTEPESQVPNDGTEPDGDDDDPGVVGDDADVATGEATNVEAVANGESVIASQSAFSGVQEIIGTVNAAPVPGPVVVGQLGTRDANSTPWMLLIGANFLVAGGALAALRLRQ